MKATLAMLMSVIVSAAAVSAEPPSVTTTAIKGPLYLLQGRGGNVLASVGDDGVLLIDDDYDGYGDAYAEALAALGQSNARYVINTHWHGDHSGSNGYWSNRGAVLVAHDNVRQRLSTDQENAFFGRTTPASPVAAWPQVTFEQSMAIHFNGDTLEIQHYPAGHTDGDSIIFFQKQNVVHMGDHFFKDRFPFIDLDSGGSPRAFIRNIAAVLQLVDEETVIVPGHGSLAGKSDLQVYHTMLINTLAEVQTMQSEGLTLKQMQAEGLDERWSDWGGGFINEPNFIAFLAAAGP